MEKTYSYEEALKETIKYFNGDNLAAEVFLGKYALRNNEGELVEKTPDQMHRRLAKEFARIEKKYPNPLSEEELFHLMDKFKYIVPQGSPMAGIGNKYKVLSLSNCYVIEEPEDSYSGILYSDTQLANLMKRRAGVGISLSKLRPKDLPVQNAAGTTTGISTFMERYSYTTREVGQSGRRGALIETISVHHPEIETFINIKKDLKKVTGANISIQFTDEFLNAVISDKEYELRWPVDAKEPKISKFVNAKDIWNKFIEAAWQSAEPGALFWDTVQKMTPSDCYRDFGFKTISVNPCFSGDTLIAVADGRNKVSIKQLAEEGKDIPVYSINKATGKVSIKTARNPRITGYNKKLLRITLDDGSHIDTTPDHKFLLKNGITVLAQNLKHGDSLPRFSKTLEKISNRSENSKYYYAVNNNPIISSNDAKIFEHRIVSYYNDTELWNEKYNSEKKNGWINGGLVVHHKDYDGLNNKPENLEIMSFKEHQQFHAEHDCQGLDNGRCYGKTSEEIKQIALEFTKELGRRFSCEEWMKFAGDNKLPKTFSKMHHDILGKSSKQLAMICATELGYENVDCDPRLVRTLQDMISQGYDAKIEGNMVFVDKQCEYCNNSFSVDHLHREHSFCSNLCVLNQHNNDKSFTQNRVNKAKDTYEKRSVKLKEEQARIWSKLKFNLKRRPICKEWEEACRKENVSYRLGTVYGFKNYKSVCEMGDEYNHKVVSIIELLGEHTVYNLTVDDNHTVGIITKINDKQGLEYYTGIYTPQCGEINLSAFDSCRLLLTNTYSYVTNPFTKEASFDFELFAKHAIIGQRLMDDIVDLELECIDNIIDKVENDPEPLAVKQIELDLWKTIRKNCENGRRTGLGTTAIGDTIAALGITYGSEESIKVTEEIYKCLAVNSYKSSVIMAKERGTFPVYDHKLEKEHPFINRIMDEDKELKEMWVKYGRRNIANLTTAPAGSVSLLTQTTSGIEPAFLLSYMRRKKINPNDQHSRVDFIDDLGDKWQEYKVYHHGFKKWMEVNNKLDKDMEQSPYFGATSNDVDWMASVKLQAAAQKWIDHSISKTCNLPADTTKEKVSEIYLSAWEHGCKGFTIYRDGSRSGVLVSDKKEDDKKLIEDKEIKLEAIQENHAPKRPEKLPCDIYNMQVKGEKWSFFVGLLDDKPYEIFAGRSKHIQLPKSRKSGYIKKNGVYNLHTGEGDNELVIEDLATVFANPTEGAFTRTLSLALRHGAPVQYIVEQLEKGASVENDMFSLSKGLMRVLKNYIKDGTKVHSKKCMNCGTENSLIYQESCLLCKSCGWSRCS